MADTLQDFADKIVDPKYAQPLKTLSEALDGVGWPHGVEFPICCGKRVEVESLIGDAHYAGCNHCGRFIADISGPKFSGGAVRFVERDKFPEDTDWDRVWIHGVRSEALS